MGQFRIVITALGGNHGCERTAKPGEPLFKRCSKFICADCLAYDFVQLLKQKGFEVGEATFTHHPGTKVEIVDDMLKNKRRSGSF